MSGFLNEVIGGVEVGRDVLCVHIGYSHLQLLETLGHLQILWVVVDANQPARIKQLPATERGQACAISFPDVE